MFQYLKIFLPAITKKDFFLDNSIRVKLYQLIPLSFISSILEILSISMLIPILAYFVELKDFTIFSFVKIQKIFDSFFFDLTLNNLLITILFLFTLKNIFLLLIVYYRHNVNNLISKNISKKLYSQYINSNFSSIYFLQTPTIIKNLTTETLLYGRYIFSFIILITEAILLLSLLIFLFYLDFKITLSIIALLSISVFLFYIFSKKFVVSWSKNREYLENLRLKNIQEVFSGFMTVKIFQLEKIFIKDFENKNNFYDFIKKERFIGETPRYFLEIFLLFIIMIIILSSQFHNSDKKELFVLISLFSVFFIRMIPSMNKILIAITSMKYCLNSTKVIQNEIKKFDNSENKNSSHVEKNFNLSQFNQEIKFENICFNFVQENKFLNQINFQIKKNKITGISGPSGSGKSTLINIIAGLLKPQSGNIFLDGKSVDVSSEGWKTLFSYVPQNIYIFEDTFRGNILLNNKFKNIPDNKIFSLIKKLKLDKIVKSEEDLNNFLRENGKNLSGGEKQRIGFARALIEEKPILILDEATNALDKKSQNEILDLIVSLKENKTIIIVSHDKEVIGVCDYTIDLGD